MVIFDLTMIIVGAFQLVSFLAAGPRYDLLQLSALFSGVLLFAAGLANLVWGG